MDTLDFKVLEKPHRSEAFPIIRRGLLQIYKGSDGFPRAVLKAAIDSQFVLSERLLICQAG